MECNNEQCELKKEIQAIRESSEEFQKSVSESIEAFQKEVKQSVKDMDSRHTKARDHVEAELRSEMQRGLMATNTKVDGFVKDTNNHLLDISSDLGEIKGALGLKVDKDETGQLRTSVMDRIELARKEAVEEVEKVKEATAKANNKILYLLITLLSSGLMLFVGWYIGNK